MKIGFLTSEYPHPKTGSSGGIGTSIFNLSKGLIDLGHKVSVFIYGQKEDEVFVENFITFYRIKNVKFKGFSLFLTQKKIEKLINQLVKQKKLDLVEAPDWTGINSRIKPNCPLVIRLHGSDTYFCHLDKRPVKFINKFHEKKALQQSDAMLSVSSYTANLTKQLFHINKEFTIITNSIDIDKFNNDQAVSVVAHTILYFGTLIRKKGALELPLIFNEVYNINTKAKLILIGKDSADIITESNSTWQLMQALFTSTSFQNVSYLGSVPYDEIKKHIAQGTICVFPSFAEAFPVSWLEAMAMGKAIIASNIGWAKELIDHEINGLLEHPNNHVAFAQKIIKLLDHPAYRNQLGTAARKKIIKNFSISVIAKQSADFYQQVVLK